MDWGFFIMSLIMNKINSKLEKAFRYHQKGKVDIALKRYKQILVVEPANFDANHLSGVIEHKKGNFRKAIKYIETAIDINGNNADAYNNLGNVYLELKNYNKAIFNFRQAIIVNPNFELAYYNLGIAYNHNGQIPEAISILKETIKRQPNSYEIYNELGVSYVHMGEIDKSIECFKKSILLNDKVIDARENLSKMFVAKGMLKEAAQIYDELFLLNGKYTSIHRAKIYHNKITEQNELTRYIEKNYNENNSNIDNKILDAFALAKIYEDLGDYNKSFHYLFAGNRIKRTQQEFNTQTEKNRFDTIKKVFNQELLDKNKKSGSEVSTQIFIIGMPRSGSTLIEQILSSHPEVYGVGEKPILEESLFKIQKINSLSDMERIIPTIPSNDFSLIANEYVNQLTNLAEGEKYICNKMLSNFLLIGLIKLILPNAIVIHSKRNKIDNCFSMFKQNFDKKHEFTYNLEDIGHYYLLYLNIMEYWHEIIPGFIYDLSYEDMINDQIGETKKLLEHIGLEWDDKCLEFYKNKRVVETASFAQVRKPIYKTSVERWRKYEHELQPLIEILDAGYDRTFQIMGTMEDRLNLIEKEEKRNRNLTKPLNTMFSAKKETPLTAQESLNKALNYHQSDKIDDAIYWYHEVLKIEPANTGVLNNLGLALLKNGQQIEAINIFEKIVSINPDYSDAYHNIGYIFKARGELSEAVKNYQKAIYIKPDSVHTLINLGIAYKEQGKREEAIKSYKKALEIKPDSVMALFNLGVILQEHGKKSEAVFVLEAAIKYEPDNNEIINYLINILNYHKPDNTNVSIYSNAQKKLMQIVPPDSDLSNTTHDANTIIQQMVEQYQRILSLYKIRNKKYPETQIWRGKGSNLSCERHFVIFNKFKTIPKYCFNCYKVLIAPKTVLEHFKLMLVFDELQLPKDNTRKCLVEVRPGMSGTYKGLIYCHGLEEAKEISSFVRPIVHEKISNNIKVSIQRGCSEYNVQFPEFGYDESKDKEGTLMAYKEEWQVNEDYADQNLVQHIHPYSLYTHNHKGLTLRDVLVLNNWLAYATLKKE